MTTIDIPKMTLEEEIVVDDLEAQEDDHETFTHIIHPPMNLHIWLPPDMTAQDIVDTARLRGWPVTALCGKTWVPNRNVDKYPACPTCMERANEIIKELE